VGRLATDRHSQAIIAKVNRDASGATIADVKKQFDNEARRGSMKRPYSAASW